MTLRKLALLGLILGFGAVVEAAWLVRTHAPEGFVFGLHDQGFGFRRGPSFSFESVREASAGGKVKVENSFGTVRVRPGEGDVVRARLRTTVHAADEAAARQISERIRFQVVQEQGLTRISTDRSGLERGPFAVPVETHLELVIPPSTAVEVQNQHGAIDVAGVAEARVSGSFEPVLVERIAGPATIEATHADVTARQVSGPLVLQARHGDVEVAEVEGPSQLSLEHGSLGATRTRSLTARMAHGRLTAREIRGNLGLEGQHVEVEASDVEGECVLATSFDSVRLERVGAGIRVAVDHGGVHVVGARGAVSTEASFDDVHLEDVEGPLDVRVSHGGARVEGLAKGGRLRTSGDDLLVTGFRGPIDAAAERASVALEPDGPIRDPIEARSRFGDVSLGVSSESKLSVEATTTRGGELQLEAPGLVFSHQESGQASAQLNGGGVRVVLGADRGDVRLGPSRRN